MPKVICPHSEKCTSHPNLCNLCTHNMGKRDYYKPYRDNAPVYNPNTWYWYPIPSETSTTDNDQFLVQWR